MSSVASSSSPRILGMSSDLYNAASKGDLAVIGEYIQSGQTDHLYSATGDSFLHIYVASASLSPAAAQRTFQLVGLKPNILHELNRDNESALHLAAKLGNIDVARVLLALDIQGTLIGIVSKDGQTALHCAARYNKAKMAELLLTADPALAPVCNVKGQTALYMASEWGHLTVVNEMLKMCAPDTSALFAALSNRRQEVAAVILEKNPNLAWERRDRSQGEYPLHVAASMQLHGVVKQLLRFDASTAFLQDSEGRTPLHYAASRGLLDVMTSILTLCPQCCNILDDKSQNFLHTAAESHEKFTCIKDILKCGQRQVCSSKFLLDAEDDEGRTPLDILGAAGCATEDAVKKEAIEEEPQELKELNGVLCGLIVATTYGGLPSVPGGQLYVIANAVAFFLALVSVMMQTFLLTSRKWKKNAMLIELVSSYTIWAYISIAISAIAQVYMVELSFMIFVKLSIAVTAFLGSSAGPMFYVDPRSFLRLLKILSSPVRVVLVIIFNRERIHGEVQP